MSSFGAVSTNGTVKQSFGTSNGARYQFSYDRQGGASGVSIDGLALALATGATSGSWTNYTSVYTAASASSLLSITNLALGNGIVFIDNVSVMELSAVPIPAAIRLFGTALIGLVGFGKRNSRISA